MLQEWRETTCLTRGLPLAAELFIIPLVRHCPERLWPVLQKILPLLMDFLVRRIFESWREMQLRNQGQAYIQPLFFADKQRLR